MTKSDQGHGMTNKKREVHDLIQKKCTENTAWKRK